MGSEWPVIVGTTIYALRNEIRQIAKTLDEATIGGQNFKFRNGLDQAETLKPLLKSATSEDITDSIHPPANAESLPAAISGDAPAGQPGDSIDRPAVEDLPPSPVNYTAFDPSSDQIALHPPSYIVMKAWSDLEKSFYEAGDLNPAGRLSSVRPGPSLEQIASDLRLPSDAVQFLHELRQLRNQAAHGKAENISLTDALRYRELANQLIELLTLRRNVLKKGNWQPKALTISINIAEPNKPVAWVSVLRYAKHEDAQPGNNHMLTTACRRYADFEAEVKLLQDDLNEALIAARSQLKE